MSSHRAYRDLRQRLLRRVGPRFAPTAEALTAHVRRGCRRRRREVPLPPRWTGRHRPRFRRLRRRTPATGRAADPGRRRVRSPLGRRTRAWRRRGCWCGECGALDRARRGSHRTASMMMARSASTQTFMKCPGSPSQTVVVAPGRRLIDRGHGGGADTRIAVRRVTNADHGGLVIDHVCSRGRTRLGSPGPSSRDDGPRLRTQGRWPQSVAQAHYQPGSVCGGAQGRQ